MQKHIDFYYFFRSQDPAFDTTYYSFPNLYTPLNIHRNVAYSIKPYHTSICEYPEPAQSIDPVSLIQGMREFPLKVNLKGRIDKITIAFKPLGINHFIKRSFAEIAPQDSQPFTEWDTEPGYNAFIGDFYKTDDYETRISRLESFLLEIYQPLEKYDLLEKSIQLLTDFDGHHPIETIAEASGLHPRSFNREFRKQLGISPIGFKKIARFRHSLTNKLFNDQFRRLTDVAYGSDFYDQSYFISMYKKMTGSNPKKFFKEIEKVGDDKILFQFVKK